MNDGEPDLRIEVKFKNARLYNAIKDSSVCISVSNQAQAIHAALGPVRAFCKLYKINYEQTCKLLNLKIGPWTNGRKPVLRPVCVVLASVLDSSVDWLFPERLYQTHWPVLVTDVRVDQLHMASKHAYELPPTQLQTVIRNELSEKVDSIIDTLSKRERYVLRHRFGLGDVEPKTCDEIATLMKVSASRVSHLEMKALRKLRHPDRSRVLRGYLEGMR